MILVDSLELASLCLLQPSLFPFLWVPTHLTFYLTSFSFPTSENTQDLEGENEGGVRVGQW